jgi:hypothetical protein
MYLLEIDRTQNRIHITLAERFDQPQASELLADLRGRFREVEPGFHILCDLTALQDFDEAAVLCFRSIMDLCNGGGVCKIIRIIPDPRHDFGLTVISHFHYDNGIPVITCRTLQEAMPHLM